MVNETNNSLSKKMEKGQRIVSHPQRLADFAAEPLMCSLIVLLALPKTNYSITDVS